MAIDYLSPSKIHFVNECKYRYALTLTSTGSKGRKVFNKNTFLGILMHSVLENYLERKSSAEGYESLWEELFNKMIEEYKIEEKDIEIIKYHLPYYEVKKNKLLHLLQSFKYDIEGFNLAIEKNICGGVVNGAADIIFDNETDKKVKIIDFKSGPFASYVNGNKEGVKAGYLFQLLTYGYVYWLDGYLPENITCALQGISRGEYEEMVFTQEEYQNHEELLLSLRASLNQAIIEGKESSLANPSPNACKYCAHNSSCGALHASMDSEVNYPSLSLIHQINSEFDDVESKINIITNGGKVSIYKVPSSRYNSVKQSIKDGKSIFVSGLYEEEQVNIKYWTRYSKYLEL